MRLATKLAIAMGSLALPVALVGALAPSAAFAGGSPVAATGSFKCSGVTGKTTYSPALSSTGSASSVSATVKIAMSGCTASDSNVTSSSFSGKAKGQFTLNASDANNCVSAPTTADVTGSMTIAWKHAEVGSGKTASKITPSEVTFTQRVRSTVNGSPATDFGGYQTNTSTGDGTATIDSGGSFAPTGTEDALGQAVASETSTALLAQCGAKSGVKKVAVGTGTFEGGAQYTPLPSD